MSLLGNIYIVTYIICIIPLSITTKVMLSVAHKTLAMLGIVFGNVTFYVNVVMLC